jgi:hypothetical protein
MKYFFKFFRTHITRFEILYPSFYPEEVGSNFFRNVIFQTTRCHTPEERNPIFQTLYLRWHYTKLLHNLPVALRLYFLFFATLNKCTRWYTEKFI